jgi:glycosyltransferase involved in cell wall biosynthesis
LKAKSFVNPPLISCIIPVFNGERYLAEAIDSIIAQTYRPLEIIVIDDGSTDGTAAVAGGYGERVRCVWQANAGEVAARNRGLHEAGGEFIAFLDADDRWHPEKLSRQLARFNERPELDLGFTRFQNFWAPELAEKIKRRPDSSVYEPKTAYWISALLVRRNAFERFGLFVDDGSRQPQNMIWFLHAIEQGAVVDVVPEVLLHRRLHSESISWQKGLDIFFPILKAWRDHQRRRSGG